MCLDVELLLQDPREDELCGDDGDRRRERRPTQLPVLIAGNHHRLRLREEKTKGMRCEFILHQRQPGEVFLFGTLWEVGIFGRKVAPLQVRMSFICTGSGFTDFVTWISYP